MSASTPKLLRVLTDLRWLSFDVVTRLAQYVERGLVSILHRAATLMPFHDEHIGRRGCKPLVKEQIPFGALDVDLCEVCVFEELKRIDGNNMAGDLLAVQRDGRISKSTAGEGHHPRVGLLRTRR